jgi:hypothetical protein
VAENILKACPFCGGKTIDGSFWSQRDSAVGVGCYGCGATADSPELWNGRADEFDALKARIADLSVLAEQAASLRAEVEALRGALDIERAKIRYYESAVCLSNLVALPGLWSTGEEPIPARAIEPERVTHVLRERDALQEALTPSGSTKAAYIGEFTFEAVTHVDDDGNEHRDSIAVPWTTVKEIMAGIRTHARALLAKQGRSDDLASKGGR